jgi:hypothetical protein
MKQNYFGLSTAPAQVTDFTQHLCKILCKIFIMYFHQNISQNQNIQTAINIQNEAQWIYWNGINQSTQH